MALRRGGRHVLAGVTFRLSGGDALLLRGPNGCGKSSLLRALAGFLPVAAGALTLTMGAGAPMPMPTAEARQHLLYSGSADGLKDSLSLADNSRFWAEGLGLTIPPPRLQAAAARLGIAALMAEQVRYFSTGQRRRAALMRFLLADRPVWLLDEPLNGLDGDGRQTLAAMVRDHRAAGGLAVIASHDPVPGVSNAMDLARFGPAPIPAESLS